MSILKKKIILICLIVVIIALSIIIFTTYPVIKNTYVQEYVPGTDNIKGDVDILDFTNRSQDFEIGADKSGYAVFKDPRKAFSTCKSLYGHAIGLIQREFHLLPLTHHTHQSYLNYGSQITIGSEMDQRDASFISKFLDIYKQLQIKMY